DAVFSDVNAALPVFEACVVGEQLRRFVPQPFVEVVAERRLEVLDRVFGLEPLDAVAIGGKPLLHRSLRQRWGRREDGERAGQADDPSHAHQRAPLTGRPVTGLGAWNVGTCVAGNGWELTVDGRSGGKLPDTSLCTSPSPGCGRAQPLAQAPSKV